MKKTISLILSAISVFTLSAAPILAENARAVDDTSCYGICLNSVNSCFYTDTNNDGTCDNCGVKGTHGYCYIGG